MARSTNEIEQQIITAVQTDTVLQPELTSTSTVAIWRRWAAILSFCINALEKLWDAFKAELLELLAMMTPHSLRWYAQLAKDFQLGFPTLPDSHLFDNTGYTAAQIEDSKVIKYVAVTEEERPGFKMFLRMKLAGSDGTDLVPLPVATVTAIKSYFETKAKDAGVKMVFESLPPDKITMEWDVYYDPTLINAAGSRLDGSASTPVKDAIVNYLKNLPFNGLYVLASHVDEVQKVEGVVIPVMKRVKTAYGSLPLTDVNVEYQPDAGWMRFENEETDLTINYIPHDAIQ